MSHSFDAARSNPTSATRPPAPQPGYPAGAIAARLVASTDAWAARGDHQCEVVLQSTDVPNAAVLQFELRNQGFTVGEPFKELNDRSAWVYRLPVSWQSAAPGTTAFARRERADGALALKQREVLDATYGEF